MHRKEAEPRRQRSPRLSRSVKRGSPVKIFLFPQVGDDSHFVLQFTKSLELLMDTQTLPDNVLTTQLKRVVNWARRSSLWPMPFATACCGIELMATASSRYDLARFGAEAMRFSPRQADLMIVAGRVTTKMMPVLQHIYQQMTEPKWVISMGACASTGGVFDAYATIQGIDQFMPVDVYVPGCPPRPETLIEGIMAIQRIIDEEGLPPAGKRRPLQVAIEPSYKPTPQPVPLTVGGG